MTKSDKFGGSKSPKSPGSASEVHDPFGIGELPIDDDVELGDDLDDGTVISSGEDVDGPELAGYSSCEEALSDTLTNLERVTVERDEATVQRDEYLDLVKRVQADFENYKRRVEGQRVEQIERAAEALVVEVLPVLDACEAAVAHGADDVLPIQSSLYGTLERRGLTKVDATDVAFDPTVHEAVLTEAGDNDDGPTVVEIMRTGYSWNGRVVRPAMVKVRS